MISATATSVHRLARGDIPEPALHWACPVPYFGRLSDAKVATLGINPSNREFVDASGKELDGCDRRFPTLMSLGLTRWGEASSFDLRHIIAACDDYFAGNPYNQWFGVLDAIVRTTGSSFYSEATPAAHLDLVPYATFPKWGSVGPVDQRALLAGSDDLLGRLLRDSCVELLILNGRSVVRAFEDLAAVQLDSEFHSEWDLARAGSGAIRGIGFYGKVRQISNVELGREVSVMGFNHNLQSSFGVTTDAVNAIARWTSSWRRT